MKSFFVMDENFLLYKTRAMELLEQHEGEAARRGRSTSSRRPTRLKKYTMRELVELGVALGLDGAGIAREPATRS